MRMKLVNDVIADKNVVTKIMNNSTGLQHIELNGFSKRHWQTGYYPFAYGWCLGLCWAWSTVPSSSEYTPILNGFIFIMCKILRSIMASAAEAEYGALFLNGQAAVPIRTTLIEMHHP